VGRALKLNPLPTARTGLNLIPLRSLPSWVIPQANARKLYRNPSYGQRGTLALFRPLGLTANGFTVPRNWGRAQIDALQAVYDAGGSLTEPVHIRKVIDDSMDEMGVQLTNPTQLLDVFVQRINNALFRHQSISWVAELEIDLRLDGKGWEAHPTFGRFARGVADNQRMLPLIYATSKINLQVTPFGAAHQRLFDGLGAGGFFLLRHINGEEYDRISQMLWQWCQANQVRSGAEMVQRATPKVAAWLDQVATLCGEHPRNDPERFFSGVADTADGGFIRSAATLFDQFDPVAFRSREDLHSRVRHFLGNPEERRQVAEAMRQRVLDCLTYSSITRRLLRFIADNLSNAVPEARAA